MTGPLNANTHREHRSVRPRRSAKRRPEPVRRLMATSAPITGGPLIMRRRTSSLTQQNHPLTYLYTVNRQWSSFRPWLLSLLSSSKGRSILRDIFGTACYETTVLPQLLDYVSTDYSAPPWIL